MRSRGRLAVARTKERERKAAFFDGVTVAVRPGLHG